MDNLIYIYIGCFLILSIYHILVFIGRRKDYINLIYALYCLSILNLSIGNSLVAKNPGVNIYYIYVAICVHIIAGLLGLFTYLIFKLQKSIISKLLFVFYIIMSIYLIILIILNNIFYNEFIITIYYPSAGIYAFFYILSLFTNFIKKKRYKERQVTIVVLGFLILLVYLIIYSILILFKIIPPYSLTYSMYLINALFFAYSLTDSFNKEHRDLIDLKNNLEKKVNIRTKQLEDAHKQKIDFFINLAHETKTPLTLITNYLDKDIKTRGESNSIRIVKNNFNKLKKDMVNFLDMEKLERGQIFYNHNTIINFSEYLKSKLILFKEIAWKKNITIKSTIEKNIHIQIDPHAIDRIINNLIDNSIKYSNEKGKIEITLKTVNNKIKLIIVDNGIGISEEQIQYIFEPYHQISHKKRNIQGIGMGLNIVKKIINEIEGKIEVKSKLNEGTTFNIFFKKYTMLKEDFVENNFEIENPGEIINKIEFEKEKYLKERKTIMIVEDNFEMLCYLQNALIENYNVFIAINGKKALEKIINIPKPNLIISDIMMDEMDGYKFYDELMKISDFNNIPFIFLTAKTSEEEKLSGLKKGAIDYIHKPFIIEEVTSKINSILKLQDKQKQKNVDEIYNQFSELINQDLKENDELLKFNIICNDYKINEIEREIIKLLINGLEYKEISSKLETSLNMVKKRVHNIYKKLSVQNKVELINFFN